MANKMIIDASHPEETRVVVLRGNRVEEFDFESASKRPLRGNIYLAKVTRVEPSLQAAFVDYGGNRHGFLAFSEIHPDYYQIPVADRQALLEEEALSQREEDEEANGERRSRRHRRPRRQEVEARAGANETVSEPTSADELGADESAPAFPSGNAEENSPALGDEGVHAEIAAPSRPGPAVAPSGGDATDSSGTDARPEAANDDLTSAESAPETTSFEGASGAAAVDTSPALPLVLELIAAGRFEVPIWKTYPLAEASSAHAESEAGHLRGKIVGTHPDQASRTTIKRPVVDLRRLRDLKLVLQLRVVLGRHFSLLRNYSVAQTHGALDLQDD